MCASQVAYLKVQRVHLIGVLSNLDDEVRRLLRDEFGNYEGVETLTTGANAFQQC